MDDNTVVITIKDGDPLCVSVTRLTADSSVFRYLLDELQLTELELEDFAPETVALFMTLLEDKTMGEIEDSQFRELHKLSVVFEVQWLTGQCQDWLVAKINEIDGPMDYDYQLFLLEECRYILNKWTWRKFTDILIAKIAFKDNTTFITRYMINFDDLTAGQLDIMLKLAGSNTKVLLEILMGQIGGKKSLDGNVKYMVENINLALCFQQSEELSNQLLYELLAISELSNDDLMFLTKLTAQSVSGVKNYFRKTRIENTEIKDDIAPFFESCQTLNGIVRLVADHRIDNMFLVVDLVTTFDRVRCKSCRPIKVPGVKDSKMEAESFVKALETISISRDKPLKRVSTEYMDMLISDMKLLDSEAIVRCIIILEMIRDNVSLSSYLDNVILTQKWEKPFSADNLVRYFKGDKKWDMEKILYKFEHPGISDCSEPEKCGFIIIDISRDISHSYHRERLSLSKEEADYNGTDLHYHDVVCAEDILYYYDILSVTLDKIDTKVRIPVRRRGCRGWWRDLEKFTTPAVDPVDRDSWIEGDQQCIAYNVKDYLVARY